MLNKDSAFLSTLSTTPHSCLSILSLVSMAQARRHHAQFDTSCMNASRIPNAAGDRSGNSTWGRIRHHLRQSRRKGTRSNRADWRERRGCVNLELRSGINSILYGFKTEESREYDDDLLYKSIVWIARPSIKYDRVVGRDETRSHEDPLRKKRCSTCCVTQDLTTNDRLTGLHAAELSQLLHRWARNARKRMV